MYHNYQWCMIHSGNVMSTKCFKIILLMKEHDKKIKMCGYQYPVNNGLPPGDFCIGLGVQSSKETARN